MSEVAPIVTLPLAPSTRPGESMLYHDGAAPEVMRARMEKLTRDMLKLPDEDKIELRVEHTVADGMYLRKLFIPKGVYVAGKIHLKTCLNIVASGSISVLTEFGMKRLEAGYTGVSGKGIQKIGFAHEDTVFINVFRTDETDLDKIEAEVACEEWSPAEPIVVVKAEELCQ